MGLLSQFSSKAELHRRETIKRFDAFLESYLAELEAADKSVALDETNVTVIARSPESAVAAALLRHSERLAVAGCGVRAIFVKLEPATEFTEFFELVGLCNGQNGIAQSIRWARNPALLEAHEQLVLGASHCWLGDAMRRASDVRFALDIFSADDAGAAELGRLNFDGLWSATDGVPRSRFRNVATARGDGEVVQFDNLRDGIGERPVSGGLVTRH